MNVRRLKFICLPFVLLAMLGCGSGDFVPVSGTVTIDGNPIENLKVVFVPKSQAENHFPGPFSSGATDAEGRFELRTKQGDRGAVPGSHSVGFTWADLDPADIGLLQQDLASAGPNDMTDSARAELKQLIKEMKDKVAGRPKLDGSVELIFEVPADGTANADFDL